MCNQDPGTGLELSLARVCDQVMGRRRTVWELVSVIDNGRVQVHVQVDVIVTSTK